MKSNFSCAVIVAEDITSRFLNVIRLFNRMIPLIAIQLQAYEISDGVALTFTKVIDELELGEDDSSVIVRGTTTRKDYEDRPKQILDMVDGLFKVLKALDPEYELRYTKYYIGLERAGAVNNFIQFRPKQHFLKLTFKSSQSPDLEQKMEDVGLDVTEYDPQWREYTIRITPKDYQAHDKLLGEIIKHAYHYINTE